MTFGYFKEKFEGKKLINQNLLILDKIGEGSFWSVFLVERIEEIDKDNEKYNYTGQRHHSLAYAYYANNYDLQIVSKFSPQVYDI